MVRLGPRRAPERRRPTDQSGKASPVYSYYNAPAAPRGVPDKIIDLAKTGRKLRLVPTLVAVVIIGLSLIISLTLSTRPQAVLAGGGVSPYRQLQTYEDAAAALLGKKLTNQTKLTINTTEIEDELLKQFPELSGAALRLPVLGRRMTLVLQPRTPVLILVSASRSYVLDTTGRIVSDLQSLDSSMRAGLLVVQDESGLAVEPGAHVVTSETVGFVQSVLAQLEAQSLSIERLTLPASANQLDVKLNGTNYYVKMDISGDARQQVGSLLAVRDYLQKTGQEAAEYIDVRVEEKVFYK